LKGPAVVIPPNSTAAPPNSTAHNALGARESLPRSPRGSWTVRLQRWSQGVAALNNVRTWTGRQGFQVWGASVMAVLQGPSPRDWSPRSAASTMSYGTDFDDDRTAAAMGWPPTAHSTRRGGYLRTADRPNLFHDHAISQVLCPTPCLFPICMLLCTMLLRIAAVLHGCHNWRYLFARVAAALAGHAGNPQGGAAESERRLTSQIRSIWSPIGGVDPAITGGGR
jgi:hypothetical protein